MIKTSEKNTALYYIHDPMCSWCWGFRPTWLQVLEKLPKSISVISLLGGLAPDSDQPMPANMQIKIRDIWRSIQQHIPGTRFNEDFWEKCQPRRSTYPACRAVIAARNQHASCEHAMILAIQEAYYLKARNPSDIDVLIDLANTLSLATNAPFDIDKFVFDLSHEETQQQLMHEIDLGKTMGATGFPSLILEDKKTYSLLDIDYNNPHKILKQITTLSAD